MTLLSKRSLGLQLLPEDALNGCVDQHGDSEEIAMQLHELTSI